MASPREDLYYELSLSSRSKKRRPPKKVIVRLKNLELTEINRILNSALKNFRTVKSQRNKSPVRILFLLDKIIPDEYFGTVGHRKIFYQIVKKILTQSHYECVHSGIIAKGYDYHNLGWMRRISGEQTRQRLLVKTNTFILDNVVKPLIRFYYKSVKALKSNELRFVRVEEWTSFKTRVFNCLVKKEFITEVEDCKDISVRGHLQIYPKDSDNLSNGNFRAVVAKFRNRDRPHNDSLKGIVSKIHEAALDMKKEYMEISLLDAWSRFVDRVRGKRIYGVKLDVKDAYGNVEISVLTKLISGLPAKVLTLDRKSELIKHVREQFVHFNKRTFRWNRGLLQGDTLSACLCELYMSHLDKTYISNFNSEDCFIHRTVDDYFFCSTEEYRVENFQKYIKNIHEINSSKTLTNLGGSSVACIPYCGYLFNLSTCEVKILFHFEGRFEIRHKFKIWNVRRQFGEADCEEFLKRAMNFSFGSNNFSGIVMNTVFNSLQTVLENFFDGMVYVAYKFDFVVMTLRNSSFVEDFDFVRRVLEHCCEDYARRVLGIIQKYKGGRCKGGVITDKLLKTLAYKAFILVLKRRNEIYKRLIEEIENGHNLKINSRRQSIDFKYFNVLPSALKTLKIARKNVL